MNPLTQNSTPNPAPHNPEKNRKFSSPQLLAFATWTACIFLLPIPNSAAQRQDAPPPPPPPRDGKPGGEKKPPRGGGPQKYSLEQAVSDQAQLHTIAFNGLAFLTGDFGADTFIPPGKVCDFFGFQYMRDIDVAQKGHNPMFLNRVAANVFRILSPEQRQLFADLAKKQAPELNELAFKRFPVIKAFCRELAGDIPKESSGLNRVSVENAVGDIFASDAELSYERARVFGEVASSLSPQQKSELAKMKFGDFNTWPDTDMEAYKMPRGTEKMINVAYMTYASEFFSWYAGSVLADTYFCPERHGTYFGGFYMKDMPAMGKKDFDISTTVTGDSGKEFLEILTAAQRQPITAIPERQRKALSEIVKVRQAISAELRKFLQGSHASKSQVIALGRRYGELDGELSYYYATAFAHANKTITPAQKQSLFRLRNLNGYTSAPAYLYSSPIKDEVAIPDTDAFFFPPRGAARQG